MENFDHLKKKLIQCVENGVELDKEGHAQLRMNQRNISFETVRGSLKSHDKIHSIKEYKPGELKNAYRVFMKLSGKKTLVLGVILNTKCIVKTVFVQTKKIQNKVEKWQRKSR